MSDQYPFYKPEPKPLPEPVRKDVGEKLAQFSYDLAERAYKRGFEDATKRKVFDARAIRSLVPSVVEEWFRG